MSRKKKDRLAPESVSDVDLVNWDPKSNVVTCTSLDVANHYGFEHRYVIGKIEKHIQEDLEDQKDGVKSFAIFHPDFAPFEGFDGQNRPLQMYAMTREGFMDIAVNFTGEDARRWKRRFRKAFSHYEKIALAATSHKADPDRIAARLEGIEVRKELAEKMVDLRDAIEESQWEGSECAKRTLCNLTKMAQKALFDRTLPKEAKLRDWLTKPQLDNLKTVERMLSVYVPTLTAQVAEGALDYHKPYYLAKERTETMVMFLGGKTEVPDFIPKILDAPALDFTERKAA